MTYGKIGARYYFSEQGRGIAQMLDANDRARSAPRLRHSDPAVNPMGAPYPPQLPRYVWWRSPKWNRQRRKRADVEWWALRWAAQDDAYGFPHSEALQSILDGIKR